MASCSTIILTKKIHLL
ncbi:TPA: hypothetical protein ACOIT4_001912 [Enterococcus faecalis]